MIRHHASEDTLVSYAAGTLPEPHACVVGAHLVFCPRCAQGVRDAEAVGGALLADLPPSPLSSASLASVLARIDTPPRAEPPQVPLTFAGLATGRWRWTGPGIVMMPLMRRDASDSRLDLIALAAGTALLEHGHGGREMTCVLQGAFADGNGEYRVGDFVEADAGCAHRPTAMFSETCICLIATRGHLRSRGLLGRLIPLLLGM